MKNNNKYAETKRREIENIISKINENKINIEQLDNEQKDELIGYYNKEICDIIEINNLLKLGKLEENDEYVFIPEKYLYISNSILVDLVGGSYE